MEMIIATCWQPGRDQHARHLHAEAIAWARSQKRSFDVVETTTTESSAVSKIFAPARSTRANQPLETPIARSAGWVGHWSETGSRRIAESDIEDLYRQRGANVLDSFYGQYALVVADPTSATLVASVDHGGFFPLYFAHENGVSLVSTSALCLASVLRRPYRQRAAVALHLTARLRSPDSAFEGIERLPGGGFLKIENGKAQWMSTWTPFREERHYKDIRECAHEGSSILSEVCRSAEAETRPVLDLTGGLDSRLIASCSSLSEDPLDVTVSGNADDADVLLAQSISRQFGWRCHHLPTPAWNIADRWNYFTKAVLLNEGELAGHQGDSQLLGKTQLAASFDLAETGGMGEILRDFFWKQELCGLRSPRLDIERVFRYRFSSNFSTPPPRLFAPGVIEDYFATEVAAARKVAHGAESSTKTQKLDVLYIWKNSGHVGRYLGSSNAALTNIAPIGTRPVLEFALSVPYRFRLRANLVRHMIAMRSPSLARFPTTYGSSAQPLSLRRPADLIQVGADFTGRSIRKIRAVAVHRRETPPSQPSMSDPSLEAFRRHLQENGLLEPSNLLSASFYDPSGLESALADARQGRVTESTFLYAIASIELVVRAASTSKQ